ncbi:WD40 repeat-like protein [Suillus brevipes Sb2]|nr:WD40 repeat-like protein [Suillus brevipes Sb2]
MARVREREALLDSSTTRNRPQATEKEPPPYGSQHCQDALWGGGNEALPPRWQRYKMLDDATLYQDDTLSISSLNRPLPGVRLDNIQLVPGCEWHISPIGRPCFVNHHTRTTSWKKPTPERPAGSLIPECIIEGHSHSIWGLACVGTSCNVLSVSEDCSIRQWKRDGKPVGKPLESHVAQMSSMAVSPDEKMVVSGSADGRLWLWNLKKGTMVDEPWEGHDGQVRCLDWSPNGLEITSGSNNGIIRRWNPDTGRQIASPIETGHGWVNAVEYSPQGDTFASCGNDMMIGVWSKDGQLLFKIKGHENIVMSLCWSKDGARIFSASCDGTIRQWRLIDGEHSSFFGVMPKPSHPFVCPLMKDIFWDLKTNKQAGGPLLHDDELMAVVMSPDGNYIASAGLDAKIYVWSVEAALKQQDGTDDANAKFDGKIKAKTFNPTKRYLSLASDCLQAGNDFFGNDRSHASASPASQSSFLRSLFSFPHFSSQLPNSSQSMPREPRYRNFNLFPVVISRRTVFVAPARDEDRYGITPESDAEAAAALQRTDGDETNSSERPAQPAAVVQGSQGQSTETSGSSGGIGEVSYEVSCCGFFFGRRRSISHQCETIC